MLNTQEDIEQFILLSSKTENEIKEISKVMSVSDQTINGILKVTAKKEFVLRSPYIIALKTAQTNNSIKVQLKNIREEIFKSTQFKSISTKTGTIKCKAIKARQHDLDTIVKNQLLISGTIQSQIMNNLDNVNSYFVVKPDQKGNSWVMLYVEPKLEISNA